MRDTGTFRLIAGEVVPEPSRDRDGPPLSLSDGAGNRIVAQAVNGFLLIRGEGEGSVEVRRFGLARRATLAAPASLHVSQGSRVTLRAGQATARLAYDPDGLLSPALRWTARFARAATPSLGLTAAALCGALLATLIEQSFYGSLSPAARLTALELVRHRQEGGYPWFEWTRDPTGGRSVHLIEFSDKARAERAAKGDAR